MDINASNLKLVKSLVEEGGILEKSIDISSMIIFESNRLVFNNPLYARRMTNLFILLEIYKMDFRYIGGNYVLLLDNGGVSLSYHMPAIYSQVLSYILCNSFDYSGDKMKSQLGAIKSKRIFGSRKEFRNLAQRKFKSYISLYGQDRLNRLFVAQIKKLEISDILKDQLLKSLNGSIEAGIFLK